MGFRKCLSALLVLAEATISYKVLSKQEWACLLHFSYGVKHPLEMVLTVFTSCCVVIPFQMSFLGCAPWALISVTNGLSVRFRNCLQNEISVIEALFKVTYKPIVSSWAGAVLWSVCSLCHLLFAILYSIQNSNIAIKNNDDDTFLFSGMVVRDQALCLMCPRQALLLSYTQNDFFYFW